MHFQQLQAITRRLTGVSTLSSLFAHELNPQDYMERNLTPSDPADRISTLSRSAKKSVAAGIAGAALTNPLDVLRNEMFKTDLSVGKALAKLRQEEGFSFAVRGMNKNLVAVAIPIAVTIFMTDFLVRAIEE